jgi:uncharacterized membrane protein
MEWLEWIKQTYLFYFFGLYVLGGRTAAILSAQWLGQNLLFFLPLIVLLDGLQIPLFYRLYEGAVRFPGLSRLNRWLTQKGAGRQQSWAWRAWSAWKGLGVFLITVMPVKGGGMWSGVLMAFSLKIPKKISYLILITGSLAGCFLLLGLGETLAYFWKAV